MEDDPENIYIKLDNTRNLIPGNRLIQRKEKEKEQKKGNRHSLQVTLIPTQTCKLEF